MVFLKISIKVMKILMFLIVVLETLAEIAFVQQTSFILPYFSFHSLLDNHFFFLMNDSSVFYNMQYEESYISPTNIISLTT
jgi:hypothetical protein